MFSLWSHRPVKSIILPICQGVSNNDGSEPYVESIFSIGQSDDEIKRFKIFGEL